jgi:glycosyltransferase involved in cell wall biosynthesis
MPSAIEEFDFNGYDLVISASSSVAKGIITSSSVIHVCYCHTPMRYAWEFSTENAGKIAGAGKGGIKQKLLSYFLTLIRLWDFASSARVDYFISNSQNVANRIQKHYRRDAKVIHAPVSCSFFLPNNEDAGDYYLVVSRLQEYKRVDLAIEACNRLNRQLIVIGDGPMRKELQNMAGDTVKMLGKLSDNELANYYAKCKALIFPPEEDYGIVPLEAMSCGRPVIAYSKGGALETVVDGKTGVFFGEQNAESLVDAIKLFEGMRFEKEAIRDHALTFDEKEFKAKIIDFIESIIITI